jgi:hypothetical protein
VGASHLLGPSKGSEETAKVMLASELAT